MNFRNAVLIATATATLLLTALPAGAVELPLERGQAALRLGLESFGPPVLAGDLAVDLELFGFTPVFGASVDFHASEVAAQLGFFGRQEIFSWLALRQGLSGSGFVSAMDGVAPGIRTVGLAQAELVFGRTRIGLGPKFTWAVAFERYHVSRLGVAALLSAHFAVTDTFGVVAIGEVGNDWGGRFIDKSEGALAGAAYLGLSFTLPSGANKQ
jgi:hypothetical protein